MSRRHPLRRFAASPTLAFGGRETAAEAGKAGPSLPLDPVCACERVVDLGTAKEF
jgi:hypothetical protein